MLNFLVFFDGWPQAGEALDVIDAVPHPSVGDGEHDHLLLLGQHADAVFDLGHIEGSHVAVEVLNVQILRRVDPILLSPNVRAHLQNVHVDLWIVVVLRGRLSRDRVCSQYFDLSAVGVVECFINGEQIICSVLPWTVLDVVSLVESLTVFLHFNLCRVLTMQLRLHLLNHLVFLLVLKNLFGQFLLLFSICFDLLFELGYLYLAIDLWNLHTFEHLWVPSLRLQGTRSVVN